MSEKKQAIKVFLSEIVIFCLILCLGIFSALQAKKLISGQEIEVSKISFQEFIIYFALGTLFILLIVYSPRVKRHQAKIYKIFFGFSFLFGSLFIFSLFLIDIFSIPLIVLLFLFWLKKPNVLMHNILVILGLSGLGYFFGLAIEPRTVILLLLVLSFYDFIAVYKTKHMIKMAGSMLRHGAVMGIIIPQRFRDFLTDVKKVKPGGKFMVLGGGDIVFPLMFSVSMLEKGLTQSIIVALFSLFGLIATFLFFFLQKEKKPIPALPLIALFSIIGYIITIIC